VASERSTKNRHGYRSAASLAQPHSEIEQRIETQFGQQHAMPRFRRDVCGKRMLKCVCAQLCQRSDRGHAYEPVEQYRDAAVSRR